MTRVFISGLMWLAFLACEPVMAELPVFERLTAMMTAMMTFAEFSHLYKAGTKAAVIDTAWRAAKLPKLGVF